MVQRERFEINLQQVCVRYVCLGEHGAAEGRGLHLIFATKFSRVDATRATMSFRQA